ncbi:type II toxin-antitoxin system PemK/MazF family toxin [Helicobacter cetorum]|uniref:type II toxin-antitoxin system PemK/MazF family toxin n=1 Tax=Helicobacter cetorum TaxID=138563 RepID=UPI000CF130E8|nr:type II toxin-antitoxin system PemK/MazF family toxin [Helicobacter cetorum]
MNAIADKIPKRQGSIWMVSLGEKNCIGHEQRDNRPFLIISNTKYNQKSKTLVGFFLSTSIHKTERDFTYPISIDGVEGHVNITQIRTLAIERCLKYKGCVTQDDLKEIMKIFHQEIIKT